MLTQSQMNAVRESFASLEGYGSAIAELFFSRLLAGQPQLRAHLPRTSIDRGHELSTWIGTVVRNLDRIDSLTFVLEDAGQRCARAGLQPLHFGQARDALIAAMRQVARSHESDGAVWSEQVEDWWAEALNTVVSVMIRGAGRARSRAA